jgi:hypothetical protein
MARLPDDPMMSSKPPSERSKKAGGIYPWLRRDAFRTSVAYLISLAIHGIIFLILFALVVLDGGGGSGTSPGGKGESFSLLTGHGRLDYHTDRTHESDTLQEEVSRQIQALSPLPQVASEVVPELADLGVSLADVTPRINPVPVASSLRNAPSTGGGMAIGPGTGSGGGLGGGIGRGFGRGFGDFVGLLHKVGFDVVFLLDGTNSMQFAIDTVKAQITALANRIHALVPNSRVGLVVYKDRGEEFVTRWSPLTFHSEKLESFVSTINAGGGGDYEEAMTEGLLTTLDEIEWRKFAHRVIVVVPSSPPHKKSIAQAEELLRDFHAKGGVVHFLDLSETMHREYEIELHKSLYGEAPEKISPLPEFYVETRDLYRRFAKAGGGDVIPLENPDRLAEQLLIAAFGQQWQKEVTKSRASN